MKFQLTFKSPDVLDQIDCENEDDAKTCRKVAKMWLDYGEYLTVEFDTDELTAIVVK